MSSREDLLARREQRKNSRLKVGVKGSEGYPILIVPLAILGTITYLVFRGGKYALTGK